ncbi:MAG: GNAT family N-acetyltransferase [Anaerolineales bacterium]|nr:GNAT family N-acetyltransferase [Anaerolineales bacterium]
MDITLTPASLAEKPLLERLMQLYLYDFTAFDGDDVDEQGEYSYKYLPLYWTEPHRRPFLLRVDSCLAGFVLVRLNIDSLLDPSQQVNSIAEFFVMKKYQHLAVGQFAARWVFNHFPGPWEVAQTATNFPAQSFWRKVISAYTSGHFREVILDREDHHGPVQNFRNE